MHRRIVKSQSLSKSQPILRFNIFYIETFPASVASRSPAYRIKVSKAKSQPMQHSRHALPMACNGFQHRPPPPRLGGSFQSFPSSEGQTSFLNDSQDAKLLHLATKNISDLQWLNLRVFALTVETCVFKDNRNLAIEIATRWCLLGLEISVKHQWHHCHLPDSLRVKCCQSGLCIGATMLSLQFIGRRNTAGEQTQPPGQPPHEFWIPSTERNLWWYRYHTVTMNHTVTCIPMLWLLTC